jgi:hypothetical protein
MFAFLSATGNQRNAETPVGHLSIQFSSVGARFIDSSRLTHGERGHHDV